MSIGAKYSVRGQLLKLAPRKTNKTSIRKSSSISEVLFNEDDKALMERQNIIIKHLTGRPFDNLQDFKLPLSVDLAESIEKLNPEVATSPFVRFDGNTALELILSDATFKTDVKRYDYFKRLKYDSINQFDDNIDHSFNWDQKYRMNLKPIIHSVYPHLLEINADMRLAILADITNTDAFNFEHTVKSLTGKFPKISYEVITANLIKIIPHLTNSQKEAFVSQARDFFSNNIIHFHDNTLKDICSVLVELGEKELLATIIHAYNEFTHSDFFNIVTPSFSEKYLNLLVKAGDVTNAREVLNRLEKDGFHPGIHTITGYVEACEKASLGVDAPKEKQEMLFNVLTKNIMSMILLPGMLNERIVSSILQFMRVHNLDMFVKYLQKNPDYHNLPEITTAIINRIRKSSAFLREKRTSQAIFLTCIISTLGFERSQYPEMCKKAIIALYAHARAPLAVYSWSKLLQEPLSADEKKIILKQLETEILDRDSIPIDISDKL